MSYIFGGNTGLTYEQMIEKRKLAEQLRGALSGAPQNIGEGLTALGQAWAGRMAGKKANEAETAGREQAGSVFASILGGQGGYQAQPPGGGFTGAGVSPPEDPSKLLANDAMAAIGKPAMGGGRDAFITNMMPHALQVSAETGLDPRLVIAQSAQETGWGKHAPGNNYFGIKSHGKGGGNTLATNEVIDGKTVRVNDSFRGYNDMGDSAAGYASFLKENPRYGELLGAGDLNSQVAALGRSGYATDPNYANSVGAIANSIPLPDGYAPGTPGLTVSTQGQPEQVMPAGGGIDPALIEALSDPYMSEGQRSVLGKLLEQQIMSGQPMSEMDRLDMQGKQLGIQKQQMELDQMQQPQQAKTLTERKQLAAEAGFTAGSPEYQTYIATGQLPTPGGGTEFGLTPVLGRDANGNVVIMQLGKDGVAVASKLPDGVTPDLSIKSAEAARGTAIGEAAGDATVKYGAQAGLVDALSGQIDDILSDPYLPKMLGPINSRSPNVTADAARVQAKLDQLSGGAFLQARQLLKGGGAITDYEGQRAEAAFVRMSQAQRPEDFATALREFQYFTQQGMQKLAEQTQLSPTSQVGTPAPAVGAPAQGAATKRFNPATGKIEAIQ